jgi:microcystin-dependent protein
MKRLLCSILLLCMFNLGYSQANVSGTKISFQGIARDNTNNALKDQTNLPISVTIFYGTGTNERTVLSETGTVNTDMFGVFSYNLQIDSANFLKISNSPAWVRISSNGAVFVQEQLRAVPYAVHAQNGVPTGTIMAFGGTTVPSGWILADGRAIPNDIYHASLRAIYGNNVPNLKGLFLRGAGTNSGYSGIYAGPSLRSTQADEMKAHTHPINISGTTTSSGNHTHNARRNAGGNLTSFQDPLQNVQTNTDSDNSYQTITSSAGDHAHTLSITGTAGANGTIDTRPINYGVNYIIKI